MGEYAKFNGQDIKIGTCESMYYLRADQVHLIDAEPGNVDPKDVKEAELIRFRFPFPSEDNIKPGDFENYSYGFPVRGVQSPDEADHYTVQFSARPGYLVSLPCPEGANGDSPEYTIHRNGFTGGMLISQQKLVSGRLVLVCQCAGCGTAWRLPTLEDAWPVIDALGKTGSSDDDVIRGYAKEIAQRIIDGYIKPNFWTKIKEVAQL